MSHLGRWLSALVDGELDEQERDRVLIHLACCEPCRTEANALRALKRRMSELGDTPAGNALNGRLMGLAQHVASSSRLSGHPRRLWPAGRSRRGLRRHRHRGVLVTASCVGVLATALGAAAFMVGGTQARPAPRVTPAVYAYWVQHQYDTGVVPAAQQHAPSHGKPATSDDSDYP